MTFDWDPIKALRNWLKHGVSFEQAITAFDDPFGRIQPNRVHSTSSEKRQWRIGESDVGVLVVTYTVRENRHRLISARRANRQERRLYEQYKTIQF